MVELVHYTSMKKLEKILELGKIIPTRRFSYIDTDVPSEIKKKAAYFILSKDLEKWKRFSYFYDWLLYHVDCEKSSIVELHIFTENINQFFVLDRIYQQMYELERLRSKKSDDKFRTWMNKLYALSIMPLKCYEGKEYVLPEVISFLPVNLRNFYYRILR